jgi:hypothetical protein
MRISIPVLSSVRANLQLRLRYHGYVCIISFLNRDKYLALLMYHVHSVAQAVSRRLPTSTARVRAQVKSCGIYGGQSGIKSGFLLVLQFPLPILILPTAPHSSSLVPG